MGLFAPERKKGSPPDGELPLKMYWKNRQSRMPVDCKNRISITMGAT